MMAAELYASCWTQVAREAQRAGHTKIKIMDVYPISCHGFSRSSLCAWWPFDSDEAEATLEKVSEPCWSLEEISDLSRHTLFDHLRSELLEQNNAPGEHFVVGAANVRDPCLGAHARPSVSVFMLFVLTDVSSMTGRQVLPAEPLGSSQTPWCWSRGS